jgi:hypothetical protein
MFADIVCVAAALSILAAGGLTVGWLTGNKNTQTGEK